MKRSIKRQLIVNFACIFIAISLSFVFCDFFLLKNLYALSKYNNIRKAYDLTNLAASDLTPGSQDFLLSFQNICMENNLNGMVFDSDNRLLASLDGAKYVPTAKFDDNPDDSTTEKYLLQKDEYTVILISNQKDPYGVIELKGE